MDLIATLRQELRKRQAEHEEATNQLIEAENALRFAEESAGVQGSIFKGLSLTDARRLRVCRVCQKDSQPSAGNPFVLNYGEEFAHQNCLK